MSDAGESYHIDGWIGDLSSDYLILHDGRVVPYHSDQDRKSRLVPPPKSIWDVFRRYIPPKLRVNTNAAAGKNTMFGPKSNRDTDYGPRLAAAFAAKPPDGFDRIHVHRDSLLLDYLDSILTASCSTQPARSVEECRHLARVARLIDQGRDNAEQGWHGCELE